jgi:dienelactone hydrolase
MDDVAASRELEKAGVEYEIQVYSAAPHGFTEWESDRYQKRADEESWDAFADFLAATRQY